LLWACYFGKEETVTELIASNKVAGTLDFQHAWRGMSNLMAAGEKGRTGIVRELLAAGAKPERTNYNGLTALLLACRNAHMEAAVVLVAATKAAGAHDVVGCDYISALMWTEMRSWESVARSLRRPALALFRGEADAVQVLNP
jgi:ankyrin repeat protein